MVHLLSIIQLALSVILVALILVQRANTDAGGALSNDGGNGTILEKRGMEKTLYRATVLIAVLFVASLAYELFLA